jgi:hypothetical protein
MLSLNRLRDLDLEAATGPGRPAHASAASGLVRIGEHLHVIMDDEAHLASFRVSDPAPGRTFHLLADALPVHPPDRKAAKPDFEVLLPLANPGREARMLALGSGSTARRERAVTVTLTADGGIASGSAPIDLALLYGAMRDRTGEINLEAGAIRGDRALLVSRAHRRCPANHLFSFSATELIGWLDEPDRPLPAFHCQGLLLPRLADVAAGITDALALPGGGWLLSAVAEATDDAYRDGACAGSALAVLGETGELEAWWPLADPIKIEGICLCGGDGELLLVNDPDDPGIAAGLYVGRLPGA